jgi:hypothetical protein
MEARQITFLVLADATLQADKGRYKEAMDRCMAMHKMARHLNERPLMCYIIGIAVNAASSRCMQRFLGETPPDVETLTWLRGELAEYNKQPYSIDHVLHWKRQAGIISMSPEKIVDAVQAGLDDGDVKTRVLERVRSADAQFYAANVAYWNEFMDRLQAAWAMPYAEAYAALQALDKQPGADFDANPAATLTNCFSPSFLRLYALAMRWQSHWDAMRAAVEIYLAKARTGQLPEALPSGVPTDPFSGEPFEYKHTADGFILRCRIDDLDRGEPYEYEFKVQ